MEESGGSVEVAGVSNTAERVTGAAPELPRTQINAGPRYKIHAIMRFHLHSWAAGGRYVRMYEFLNSQLATYKYS